MKTGKLNQGDSNFIRFFFDLFYRIKGNQNDHVKEYIKTIDENLLPSKKKIDVLICGAGSCVHELPVLLTLFDKYEKVNLTFVDKAVEPLKLLHYILKKFDKDGNVNKEEIVKYFEENHDDIKIEVGKKKTICNDKVTYTFQVMDLELDPNPDSDELTIAGRVSAFEYFSGKEYDIVMMSMFLQHISYWRSLIAFLNDHLKDDGYFWFNEFGKDDYLLTLDLYMAIIDNKCKSQEEWIKKLIKYVEDNKDKDPKLFSIISDNDEISPTNTEICRDFFDFFGSEGKVIFKEDFQSEMKPSVLFNNAKEKFSPFTKLFSFIDNVKSLLPTFIENGGNVTLDFSMIWYAYKKVTDKRIKHFNVLDKTRTLSIPVLQQYINQTLDTLSLNSTIFRPTFLRRKNTSETMVKSAIDLFKRFQLFKIGDYQSIVFFIPGITSTVCFKDTKENYENNFKCQKQFKEENIDKYNGFRKERKRAGSNSALFFDKYKTKMTKPFSISYESLDSSDDIDWDNVGFEINEYCFSKHRKVHIIKVQGKDDASVINKDNIVTPLGVDYKLRSLRGWYETYNYHFKGYRSIFIPCFREPLFDRSKEFLGDLIIFQEQDKGEDNLSIEFFSWLIRKFVDFTQIATYLDYKRIILQSIKSAKAAIMSRNMSHNLGSHVMFYIKQKLESVGKIINEGVLVDLLDLRANQVVDLNELNAKVKSIIEKQKKADNEKQESNANNPRLELPFLVGLGRFLNYLQERQDYIATVSTDYIPYKSSISFKDAIYDELKPELRAERHGKDSTAPAGIHPENLLLDYIAYSEGFESSDRIELWFGDKFSGAGDPKDVPEDLRKMNVALPGGNLGRQAFFSIMENVIRNAAKHDGRHLGGKNLKFTFDIINNKDDVNIEEKIKYIQSYTNKEDYPSGNDIIKTYENHTNDYWFLGITVDSQKNAKNAFIRIGEALNTPYVDDNGEMSDRCKGIKEIRISAAWMRGYSLDTEIPVDEPPAVAICNNNDNLQYVICLPKPKKIAFVTDKSGPLDTVGRQKFVLPTTDEEWKEIADFELIVCTASDFPELQKYVGARILCVDDVPSKMEENEPDVLFEEWLKKHFNSEHFKEGYCYKGPLPQLVINDGKAYDAKHDNVENKWKECIYEKLIEPLKLACNNTDVDEESKYTGKLVFSKHYDGSQEDLKEKYCNATFLEGVSGGNSTDRLIRHDIWTMEWYVKHMAAALTRVAIFDERIYSNFIKPGYSPFADWNANKLMNWLKEQFPKCLDGEKVKYSFFIRKLKEQFGETLEVSQFLDTKDQTDSPYVNITLDESKSHEIIQKLRKHDTQTDCSNAALNAQKGIWVFNIVAEHKETMRIVGYANKEECNIATITKSGEDGINITLERGYNKKFHFISIHQGILDKIYETFGIKGKNKKNVTNELFEKFSACCTEDKKDKIKENNNGVFLPQFVIHSGRSLPNKEDMPQNQPFIQFAALDHAVRDCKYTLTELLYSAHYEKEKNSNHIS